jgi:hypothetical protein
MANDFLGAARLREQTAGMPIGGTALNAPPAGAATASVALPASIRDLRQFRIGKRESQEKFWGRFGVTQSSGSRFETGLAIPAPVAILLKLYANGKLSDGDLQG